MFRTLFFGALIVGLSACTQGKVTKPDATGHFPTSAKATVVSSVPCDLDQRKDLILVANSDFIKGEITNMDYFNHVITMEDLEKIIVQQGLSEKVPSLQDAIGVSKAAKAYKPFLWLHGKTHGAGTSAYAQFILTDALTLDDLLVVETHLDYLWTGVNDQNNWYPMFNALIDYIQANSKTYRR